MSTTNHRLWFLAWTSRHGKAVSQDLTNIFGNRVHDILAAYEKQEPINLDLLEAIRIRECAKLLKEAGHG